MHTAFDIKTTSDWAEATDLRTREELQAELSRLRALALMCVNAKMDNKRIDDKLDVNKKVKASIAKDPGTTKLLKDCMRENPLFKRCREEETDDLVGQFEKVQYGASKQIITQGETGDTFYVIESGICDAFIKGTSKAVASPARGMGFGELALMYNIKKHRFFSGFGWDDLLSRNMEKLKPPIEVKVADEADAHNFDQYEEQQEDKIARKSWNPPLDDA